MMRLEDLRILVLDDNAETRRHITAMLCQIGVATLFEAADGIEGLDLVKDELPDLLLLGHVPDAGGGIAFTRQIRAEVGVALPIIIVSRYAELWRLGEAKTAGADGFLVQPFTPQALIRRLEGALAARPAGHHHKLWGSAVG